MNLRYVLLRLKLESVDFHIPSYIRLKHYLFLHLVICSIGQQHSFDFLSWDHCVNISIRLCNILCQNRLPQDIPGRDKDGINPLSCADSLPPFFTFKGSVVNLMYTERTALPRASREPMGRRPRGKLSSYRSMHTATKMQIMAKLKSLGILDFGIL